MANLGQLQNRNLIQAISELIKKDGIPFKVQYRLLKMTPKINEELKIYNQKRNDIITKYCDKKEDGTPNIDEKGTVSFSDENSLLFNKDMSELDSVEADVGQIELNDLLEIKDLTIAPNQLAALMPIIKE